MTWQPKYIDMKLRAKNISTMYRRGMTPKEIAESEGLTWGSVYRYLRYSKDMTGRFKDSKNGQWVSSRDKIRG
jgi:transposase